MPRLTIAVVCAALALTLGACGKDDENETSGDTATVTTNPTPAAGTSTQSEAQESDDIVSVGIKDITFVPAEITAKVGQTITWTNHEPVPHNVTAEQGADFRSENLTEGDTFDYTPRQAGTIDYVCTIHPGQDGTITVTK